MPTDALDRKNCEHSCLCLDKVTMIKLPVLWCKGIKNYYGLLSLNACFGKMRPFDLGEMDTGWLFDIV